MQLLDLANVLLVVFIANGHKVIATGRREERLKALKEELGDNLYTAQLDVRNRAAIEEMIAGLPAQWQAIDVPGEQRRPGVRSGTRPSRQR